MEKLALNANNVLKSLPKGFIGASMPKNARDVWVCADINAIKPNDAKKAIKELCKTFGLDVIGIRSSSEDRMEWHMQDKAFNKQMVADARACASSMKAFFKKYGHTYRYVDAAGTQISCIAKLVTDAL